MHIHPHTLTGSAIVAALTLGLLAPAVAQTTKAGDIQRLEGTAAVQRTSAPEGTPLKVKDEVFVRDLLSTGEQSKAQLRVGRALVTMRELSKLRITELPGSTSTIDITDGKLKLFAKELKAGERIDVKTPNAVTAVRGTTIVVEVQHTPAGVRTLLSVLNGFVEITPLDPVTGRPSGPPTRVNDLQQTTVNGSNPPTAPVPINRNDAIRLDATFAFKLQTTVDSDLVKRQAEQAAKDAAKIQTGGGTLPGTGDGGPAVTGDDIRSRSGVIGPLPPAGGRPATRGN